MDTSTRSAKRSRAGWTALMLAGAGLVAGCGSAWAPGTAAKAATDASAAAVTAHAQPAAPSPHATDVLQLFLPLPLDSHTVMHACASPGCAPAAAWTSFGGARELPELIDWLHAAHPDIRHGLALAQSADGLTLAVGVPAATLPQPSAANDTANAPHPFAAARTGHVAAGEVHLYRRSVDGWVAVATLRADVPGDGQQFGRAVSLSADGQLLAVGAVGDGTPTGSGAVHLFVYEGGVWVAKTRLQARGLRAGDYFGSAVALSADGRTLAVGAPGDARGQRSWAHWLGRGSGPNSGSAYVFKQDQGQWVQTQRLTAPRPQAHALFGYAVALSPDAATVAISAVGQVDAVDATRGAVHTFGRDGMRWQPRATWAAPRGEGTDLFGHAMALSDDGQAWVIGSASQPVAAARLVAAGSRR